MRRPWQTPAWKKRRAEFLKGKSCEWCGSEKELVIHHPRHFNGLNEYKKTVNRFMKEYFSNKENESERQRILAEAKKDIPETFSFFCPDCGHKLQDKKTKVCLGKCEKCGTATDEPLKNLAIPQDVQLVRTSVFFSLNIIEMRLVSYSLKKKKRRMKNISLLKIS